MKNIKQLIESSKSPEEIVKDEPLKEAGSEKEFVMKSRLLGEKLFSGRMSDSSYVNSMKALYKDSFPNQF